jgi:hypothetical protein
MPPPRSYLRNLENWACSLQVEQGRLGSSDGLMIDANPKNGITKSLEIPAKSNEEKIPHPIRGDALAECPITFCLRAISS